MTDLGNFTKTQVKTFNRRHPLHYFNCVYVINLQSRPDRRRQMQAEFVRIGFPSENLEWFDAIKPDSKGPFDSIGARGCLLSHLAVLGRGVDQNIERLLLLEDDADFAADFNARMNVMSEQLSAMPWDMFYGGGRMDNSVRLDGTLARIDPATLIGCSHFIAFQGNAIHRVHDYIKAQLNRPKGDPAGGPMHVDGSYCWARRELSLQTLIANPHICHQRSSRSDITAENWWDKVPGIRELAGKARGIKRLMTRSPNVP